MVILTGCNSVAVQPITTDDYIKFNTKHEYEYQYYNDYEAGEYKIKEAVMTKIDDNAVSVYKIKDGAVVEDKIAVCPLLLEIKVTVIGRESDLSDICLTKDLDKTVVGFSSP